MESLKRSATGLLDEPVTESFRAPFTRPAGILGIGSYAPERVLATAGSETIVRFLPHVLPSVTHAAVVWPTYSSHMDSWQRLCIPVGRIYSVERASLAPGTVVTLVNPNNPDGSVTPREQLFEAHDKIAANDGFLVIDEAFADTDPGCSVAPFAGTERYPRMIVFRSFGKFYGLA
ncbi:MAG: aminotransferase class I/II-fold pyridoxal phosphate-dependent enzyme, partial [Actinomycetota bacterium]